MLFFLDDVSTVHTLFNNAFGLKAIICLGILFRIFWQLKNTLPAPLQVHSLHFVSVFALISVSSHCIRHFNCQAASFSLYFQTKQNVSAHPRYLQQLAIRPSEEKLTKLQSITSTSIRRISPNKESNISQPFVGELFGDGVPLADSLLAGNCNGGN